MCDYSLHAVASRPATIGDRLVTTGFANTYTRGFAAVEERTVAVCLLPGTELAFDNDMDLGSFFGLFRRRIVGKMARFRQMDSANPHTHHDALEFSNGRIVLLTHLPKGQHATVLQLPAAREASHSVSQGRVAIPA